MQMKAMLRNDVGFPTVYRRINFWGYPITRRVIYCKCIRIVLYPSLITVCDCPVSKNKWTASSEFGTYRLCEQRRFRPACASTQSRQNLRCSLIQAVSQEEPSDRKPNLWPLWMAGHAKLKFVMTECSKTQIRLTGLKLSEMFHV